ncbi:aldo/keto reductase [Microbacterium sp. BK668]|uniref:aldo/keto reductase n=1 Tax=Microbacterium sp. BK668 TaxID=2512118 RepID=UPI00105C35F5|nr:aldo/keto reductase [Microbacterium sp. BK668]TDN91552.1 D-threo-aldose 1-dehydrogenase [Microbacterium sp. BK668]
MKPHASPSRGAALLSSLDEPVGFGAAPLGNMGREISDEQAHATLAAAWATGIRYFDTAPHYGLGLSEQRLGAFLREQRRDEYVLSTKVGRVLEANPDFAGGRDLDNGFDVPNSLVRRFDPSAEGIRRSLDASLERLGIDRIDVLYLHDPDQYDLDRGIREGLPALAALRDEGIVGAIGVGVNSAEAASRAVREADIDIVMIAGRYTLLEQQAGEELLPLCQERGIAVADAAVFNSGLLAVNEPRAGARYNYRPVDDDALERARILAATCGQFGVDLPTAALHYPLRHPAVDVVVIGSSRAEQIVDNMARLRASVPDELWRRLRDTQLAP